MAVVKADGYGHGAVTVARAAVAAGAGWLGTTSVAEACALRAAGLAVPILTWLHPSGIDAEAAAAARVDVAVGSVDELGALLAHAAVDGAGPSPRGHRDVPGRLPPPAVGRTDRSRSAWSTGSEGPRRGCHGASSAGRPGRPGGERAGGRWHARGAAGGPGGGARFAARPSRGHVGDADRPGDPLRHGPRRRGTGRHRSLRDRGRCTARPV